MPLVEPVTTATLSFNITRPPLIADPRRRVFRIAGRGRQRTSAWGSDEVARPARGDAATPADDATRSDDVALLARLKAGEDAAYAELVRRHGGRMLAVARRYLHNEDAAQDCVQEAFLAAFRALDRFEGRSSLATWLHRITVNAALQALRRRGAKDEVAIEPWMPTFDEEGLLEGPTRLTAAGADELIARDDVRTTVRAAIDRLPTSYRNVLLLRDIEGLSIKEVADMLEVSENNAKVRLHRARNALKKELEPLLNEGAL
jgi:RNA polymerase sigma-70 factor (ECF subfamily)